jgi:hypothetical protein
MADLTHRLRRAETRLLSPPGDLDERPRLTRCTRARRRFFGSAESTLPCATLRSLPRFFRRASLAVLPRSARFREAPNTTCRRHVQARFANRAWPPRGLGKSDRVMTPCFGTGSRPSLTWPRWPTGEVVCKGRHALSSRRPPQTPRLRTPGSLPRVETTKGHRSSLRAQGPKRLPAPRPFSAGHRSGRLPPGPPHARVSRDVACSDLVHGPVRGSFPHQELFCPAGTVVCDDLAIT